MPILPLQPNDDFVVVLEDKAAVEALPIAVSSRSAGQSADQITPHIIRDLLAFSHTRVESGEANDALQATHADIPDLIAGYRIGFLPKKVSAALSREAKHATAGLRLGNTLIVPAFDDQGIAVDLLTVFATGKTRLSLFTEPRGLLAPEVLHRSDNLIVTDSFSALVQHFRDGHRNVLLLRGLADANNNSARIAAAGVKRITLHARKGANQIADALRAAGLEVVRAQEAEATPPVAAPIQFPTATATTSAPAPAAPPASVPTPAPAPAPLDPNAPVFVEEEAGEVAIFQAGTVRYSVTMRTDGVTKRRVVIRANGKSCAHDLDLAVPAARERTAGNAARQVGLPPATIAAHLVAILAGVQAREEARLQAPAVALSAEERDSGAALLADPHLIDRVTADLGTLGWIGEDQTKALLYLVSISRLLPQPLWAVYRSTGGAAPWQALACISALTPPEAVTQHHRVTDRALNQSDPASLRHHLLIIDQAETIRPDAAITLRILKERGGVGQGGAVTETRGPVAVLAAAAGDVDHRCRDCFQNVSADESPEATARILAEQRKSLGLQGSQVVSQAAVAARHQAAQRLLEPLPVAIPFIERIAFPATCVRHREEQRWFLGLIAASALLHQRQRRCENSAVIATEPDFDIAARLAKGLLGAGGDGLSRDARDLVAAVERAGLAAEFTMADLPAILPDATRWTLRAALQELTDFGYVESPRAGRGRLRGYHLTASAAGIAAGTGTVGIRLRNIGDVVGPQVGGLAEVGGIGAANLKRSAV